MTNVTTPTGRLRKKMARQLTDGLNAPPTIGPSVDKPRRTSGPAAVDTAPPTVHSAIARAGAVALRYACRTSANDEGSITAAALPCTSRATISRPNPGARPQAAEAKVKTASPA